MEIQDLEYPTKLHTGVLYVQKSPLYIVEVIEEKDTAMDYITVYEAHKPRKKEEDVFPTKAYDLKKEHIGGASPKTLLGRLANKRDPGQTKIRRIERPPLFMEELRWGTNSLNGVEGLGFYEREKDTTTITKKEGVTVKHGEYTGVFITLDSITWGKVTVPAEGIIEDYLARKTLFFQI